MKRLTVKGPQGNSMGSISVSISDGLELQLRKKGMEKFKDLKTNEVIKKDPALHTSEKRIFFNSLFFSSMMVHCVCCVCNYPAIILCNEDYGY